MADRPRWLVFGIGNPSRGDDALGSAFVERLGQWLDQPVHDHSLPMELVLETDFQCQVEHALDLAGKAGAIFVDASLDAPAPFQVTKLQPDFDATHTTHALSPACVLAVAQNIGQTLPPCWLLAIPGSQFELGADLSPESSAALELALQRTLASLAQGGGDMFAQSPR